MTLTMDETIEEFRTLERHVAGYVTVPVKDWSKIPAEERERLLASANTLFDHQPGHQCYWNDRFCVATLCGLSEEKQRQAAWCLVSNGINNYWEWYTHGGYELHNCLFHLKIKVATGNVRPINIAPIGIPWSCINPGYTSPPRELLLEIIKHFRLPTSRLDLSRALTESEQRERDTFNKIYPHHKVL